MKTWILTACALSAALGQQAEKLAFEVASIKPAEPMPMGKMMIRMSADAGMVRYTNVSLKQVIQTAYRVKEFQVQGPDWINGERFDITAKIPDGVSKEQVPEMLQTLLADRFKLVLHRQTKESNIYALVVAKGGPKLTAAENPVPDGPGAAAAGPHGQVEDGPGGPGQVATGGGPGGPGPITAGRGPGRSGSMDRPMGGGPVPGRGAMMLRMDTAGMHLKARSVTLSGLADVIAQFSERPVVDETNLKGQYDFDLVFAPETVRNMPGGMMMRGPAPPPGEAGQQPAPAEAAAEPAGSIYDSVARYGLKLEPRKAPLEILVVDRMEKEPTEN